MKPHTMRLWPFYKSEMDKKMDNEPIVINLGFVNVYLLKAGDGYVLVDTGAARMWSQLETELVQAGCLPDNLKLVVVTHGDFDHAGNCAELRRKYGAKIAMHAGDLDMVRTGVPVKRKIKGVIGRLLLWIGGRMVKGFTTFQPDILLEDMQVISGYGLTAKIIHTPGHTSGSIALLTDDGHLFVGDTISNRTKPSGPPLIEDEQKFHDSLVILKQTNARMVYPGHGKPFPFEALLSVT
jgi:hydroxyacylglutathione hydrolase